MSALYRFDSYNLRNYWKEADQLNKLLLIKNQEFPTFEEFTTKLEHITQLIRETYPKYLQLDHPTIQKKSFIYIYEKFDAFYRQEFLTLQNPHDLTQEIESKRKISMLLQYEMTIPKIATNPNEVEISSDLVNLIQVLFHDTELLDKLLLILVQKSFGSLPHTQETIQLNTKVYNFILPFFRNSGSIFHNELNDKDFAMENILSDIKEILIHSTSLKEEQIAALYNDFDLALKTSAISEKKVLFSKIFTFKQEFKTEDAYYELLGHLSLLNYYCNQGKLDFLKLKTSVFFYAFNLDRFCPENRQKYDSSLLNKLSYVQPLPHLARIKFISSSLKRTLKMLLQEASEDLLELLEFQLLVINSTLQIAIENPQESSSDLFLEIWSQLYEFIENNKEKLQKLNSKHQFLLPLYDSLMGEWIDLIRNLQEQHFFIKRGNYQVTVIPKYQTIHLKFLNKLLLLLSSTNSKFLQESIIELLNKVVKTHSSYLSKLDLKRIFSIAEQQILEKFFPNLKVASAPSQDFSRLLRVIETCFNRQWESLLKFENDDDKSLLNEMQNSKLLHQLFALYEENPSIASNIADKSKLNDYLSILHFFIKLLRVSPEIYSGDERYRSKFNLIITDLLGSELQLIDPVQYSIMATHLAEVIEKTSLFAHTQDEQTIFLFLKFYFFQPQYQIIKDYELQLQLQLFQDIFNQIHESHPDGKTFLAEMMISLLNTIERKVQDPKYNIWEELLHIEKNQFKNSSQKTVPFIFPIDSKVNENLSLEIFQDLVKRMTFKSSLNASFASENLYTFAPEKINLAYDLIKATFRIVISPLLIFMTPCCISKTAYLLKDLYNRIGQHLNSHIEGLIIGINDLFEKFKLNGENLSIPNISAVFSEISEKGFLSIEFLPKDLTWREAAFGALVLMLKLYGGALRTNKVYLKMDFRPGFYQEFCKANQNLKTLFENYLKRLSLYQFDKKDFSQNWIQNLSVLKNFVEGWGGFCLVINKKYSLKMMVDDIYKSWMSGFDFISGSFAYNLGILDNFLNILPQEEGQSQKGTFTFLLSTTEILQHLLSLLNGISLNDEESLELYFLNDQSPRIFKRFYDPVVFYISNLENTNYETQTVKNFKAIKQLLSNKNLLTILSTNNGPLIENIKKLLDCCFDMYKIYDNYSSNQVKRLEIEVEKVKAIKKWQKEKQEIKDKEEDMDLGLFGDPEEEDQEENYPQKNEEEDFFGGFDVDNEVKVEKETAPKVLEEVDNEILELEKALKGFLNQCKYEVESFVQSCFPNLLLFVDLDDKLLNIKVHSFTIPKNFWLDQCESLYKTILLYIAGLLADNVFSSVLEKEAKIIQKSPLDIDIFTVKSSIKAQDELMALKLLYNLMTKFALSSVMRMVNFSSDCIHGLILVTNSKLKELMGNLPESGHNTQFLHSLANFLQDLAKLAIHLIILTASRTLGIVNNHDSSLNSFFLLTLEFIANSFLLHEIAVNEFKTQFLEHESMETTLITTLIQLANVVLAANKNLRISFVEKGLLDKLLTAKRFTLWTRKEADAILSLFALILEDCFPIETQVELVIKEFFNEKNEDELSLNSLLNYLKFLPFKDHPKSLDPIKAYAFTRNDRMTLALKDFVGKGFLIDYTKDHEKVNAIEYLQRAISPLAQKSIQTLLRAFMQNLAFEKNLIQQQKISPLKEIKSIIELLASIMFNFPYLTPHIVFQEFKDHKTTLDVLLTFALERDGESALFLVGSLLKGQNSLYVAGEPIKSIFLLKIFNIINNMLDIDNSQKEAFSSFETTSMRFHIAQVLAFINKQVQNKERISDLITLTTQKLFKGIKNALRLIAETSSYHNFISEISQIVEISMTGLVTPKDTKDYISFLKVIEKESSDSDKNLQHEEDKFNQLIFKYEGIFQQNQTISHWNGEELKKYEMQKFYMMLNLENKSDFTFHFPLNESTFAELRENLKGQHHQHCLYFKEYRQEGLDYLEYYRKQSPIFSQMRQSFHERLDPNRNNSFKKFKIFPSQKSIPFNNLKISTLPYSAFLQQEQIKLLISENKEEIVDEIQPSEEVNLSEYQAYDLEGNLRIDYFVRDMEKETQNFQFLVNKAVQKARRLKEIIQLEKVYNKMVHKEETNADKIREIVNNFTKDLVDFDRNVIYTALGKEIKSCLSPEIQAEIKIMYKQLKAIKENPYIPSEVVEEEDDYYDEFDYDEDFRFLKETQQNEQQEVLSDASSSLQTIEEDPEIIKTIRTFKLDDMTVMELCMPFFGDSKPIVEFSTFLNNTLFKNPANELKILDTLLFILYTPELMGYKDELPTPLKSLNHYSQQVTTKNIIEFLHICLNNSSTKTFLYLTPVTYLNKFGNQLLINLKEKTHFYRKTENCYSVLDLIIGLLENKTIVKDEENVKKIIGSVKNIFSSENRIVLAKGDPNAVVAYKNYFSPKNLHILFNLISDDSSYKYLSDLMESFRSQPKLLISLQDDLTDIFSSNARSLNKIIEPSLTQDDFEKVLDSLNLTKQAKSIEILLRCFASACHKFCLKDLQNLVQTLFNQEDIQRLFFNISQLLEIFRKHQDNCENSLETLLKICFFYSSILFMTSSSKNPSINSLSELDPKLPQLKRLVTKDQYDFITYQKSSLTDFTAIFSSFVIKYMRTIFSLRATAQDDQLFLDIFLVLLSKWPWLLDLDSKQEILREKLSSQYDRVDIFEDDRRDVLINRRNAVHSSINSFKNLEESEILQNLYVEFRNEDGSDGGGLRRDYYILISKELFAPEFGLFKLSANKHSIQPNPLSSIIPNYLLYFEFAGIIVAKAIEDEQLMDVNFTKSFLKHILDKEPAISDLEDYDADLAKNLQWMLENNVEDISATFTYETEILGQRIIQELCEGGYDIEVTEENKKDYIKKVCEAKMTKEIQKQTQAFLKGFRTILPKDFLSYLSTSELQLLISGAPEIDLEDMKKHAKIYVEAELASWFWEILSEFNSKEIAAFWHFVSGSSKVPYGGFKENRIEISSDGQKGTLPVAATCNRGLRLPAYESKEELKEKLLMAISDGVEGFYLS